MPREEVVHAAAGSCPSCGGDMRRLGEDVTEILEYRPGRFHVIRHLRPKFSCRRCEAITQAAMPDLPIERGRPGPGLLAHVLVSKSADTSRFTSILRSMTARASSWKARSWPTGAGGGRSGERRVGTEVGA